MPRQTDSRARMIETAVELFRRQGYHATAFSELVAESGAPRGSIYFHFPGGNEELALAPVALAADEAAVVMTVASAQATDAASFVRAVTGLVQERLGSSDYRNGCAIATMVLELAPQVESARSEFDKAFWVWRTALAEQFERYGYAPARAADLGALYMSILEGALLMARAARSLEPLETASETFISLLEPPAGSSARARKRGSRPASR
jgi:TetR/AcrR family transcriptional regulator, lmrAB and yxaGH operons repressor